MPQLDFGTFPSQIFWLGLCFAILYVLMSKIALPRIEAVLVARRHKIATDKQDAESLKERADAALSSYEECLAEARAEAAAQAEDVKQKIEAQIHQERRTQEELFEKMTREAQAQVEKIREDGKHVAQNISQEIAHALVEQLTGLSPAVSRGKR